MRHIINPEGGVRPCEFHPSVLGNIFKESLSRIIEKAKKTDFIKSRKEGINS